MKSVNHWKLQCCYKYFDCGIWLETVWIVQIIKGWILKRLLYNYVAILSIAITLLSCRDRPHSYHSCDIHSIHIQLWTIFCWLLLLKLCFCVHWRKPFSSVQLNAHHVAESCTVEPLYYGHLGGHSQVSWESRCIQVTSYAKAPFGTTTKCVYYTGVHVFKYPD